MSRKKDPRLMMESLARQNLAVFVRAVFGTLNPADEFKHNWHLDAICHALERVWKGETKRLIITLPPRSLKSIIASVAFPAFILGHDPTRRIICASYNQDLATKMHNDFRQVIGAGWFKALFAGARIGPWKDTGQEVILDGGGSRYATSVGGPLTGRGGDVLIFDDILKAQDAHSERVRTETNNWLSQTAFSRLNDKIEGAVIVIMQRLHVDDPVGHLLDKSPEGWDILNLPAIAPTDMHIPVGWNTTHLFRQDEVLHPEREPRHILERIRAELGSATFSAQYLQTPVPSEGTLVKRHWIKHYEVPPPMDGLSIVQSWDTASKTAVENDYSACVTLGFHDGRRFVLDVYRAKLTYPDLRTKAIELAKRYGASRVYVEDVGIGTGLISELRTAGLSAVSVAPKLSKQDRLRLVLPLFESETVWLPARAPWLSEFESELLAFPNGRHDDQVDALSQALHQIQSNWLRFSQYGDGEKITISANGVRTVEKLRKEDPPISRRREREIIKMTSWPPVPPAPERPPGWGEYKSPGPMKYSPPKSLARPTGLVRKPPASPPPPAPDQVFRSPVSQSTGRSQFGDSAPPKNQPQKPLANPPEPVNNAPGSRAAPTRKPLFPPASESVVYRTDGPGVWSPSSQSAARPTIEDNSLPKGQPQRPLPSPPGSVHKPPSSPAAPETERVFRSPVSQSTSQTQFGESASQKKQPQMPVARPTEPPGKGNEASKKKGS